MAMVQLRTPTRMDHVSRSVANFTLSLLTVVMLGFIATAIYPWNPVTRLDISLIGAQSARSALDVRIDYCKAREWTPVDVRWALVNDITIVLPTTLMSMPVGCHVKQVSVPMPIHAIPGRYQLQQEVIYRPWPWKTITYLRRTPWFQLGE